jgi:hypothetical protein
MPRLASKSVSSAMRSEDGTVRVVQAANGGRSVDGECLAGASAVPSSAKPAERFNACVASIA